MDRAYWNFSGGSQGFYHFGTRISASDQYWLNSIQKYHCKVCTYMKCAKPSPKLMEQRKLCL